MRCIKLLVDGKTGLPHAAVQEFGFLQLRMICEVIALSCLTAHGDLKEVQQKSLQKTYDATIIIKKLGSLHPDFYPRPTIIKDIAPGRKRLEGIKDGFLTKADLKTLYGRCGDLLHRGSVKKLWKGPNDWPTDNSELDSWAKKIARLMGVHFIGHLGGKTRLIAILSVGGGGVEVSFAGPPTQTALANSKPI